MGRLHGRWRLIPKVVLCPPCIPHTESVKEGEFSMEMDILRNLKIRNVGNERLQSVKKKGEKKTEQWRPLPINGLDQTEKTIKDRR